MDFHFSEAQLTFKESVKKSFKKEIIAREFLKKYEKSPLKT